MSRVAAAMTLVSVDEEGLRGVGADRNLARDRDDRPVENAAADLHAVRVFGIKAVRACGGRSGRFRSGAPSREARRRRARAADCAARVRRSRRCAHRSAARSAARKRRRRKMGAERKRLEFGVHPDAGDLLLFAHQDRLDGAAEDDSDVGCCVGHAAARIDDRAEQQQLRAGEAVADLRPAGRRCRARAPACRRRSAAARAKATSRASRSFTDIRSRKSRPAARPGRAASAADEQDDHRKREAQQVGLDPQREHRAILGADHAADEQQGGEHDVDRAGRDAWTIVVAALTARIIARLVPITTRAGMPSR